MLSTSSSTLALCGVVVLLAVCCHQPASITAAPITLAANRQQTGPSGNSVTQASVSTTDAVTGQSFFPNLFDAAPFDAPWSERESTAFDLDDEHDRNIDEDSVDGDAREEVDESLDEADEDAEEKELEEEEEGDDKAAIEGEKEPLAEETDKKFESPIVDPKLPAIGTAPTPQQPPVGAGPGTKHRKLEEFDPVQSPQRRPIRLNQQDPQYQPVQQPFVFENNVPDQMPQQYVQQADYGQMPTQVQYMPQNQQPWVQPQQQPFEYPQQPQPFAYPQQPQQQPNDYPGQQMAYPQQQPEQPMVYPQQPQQPQQQMVYPQQQPQQQPMDYPPPLLVHQMADDEPPPTTIFGIPINFSLASLFGKKTTKANKAHGQGPHTIQPLLPAFEIHPDGMYLSNGVIGYDKKRSTSQLQANSRSDKHT